MGIFCVTNAFFNMNAFIQAMYLIILFCLSDSSVLRAQATVNDSVSSIKQNYINALINKDRSKEEIIKSLSTYKQQRQSLPLAESSRITNSGSGISIIWARNERIGTAWGYPGHAELQIRNDRPEQSLAGGDIGTSTPSTDNYSGTRISTRYSVCPLRQVLY